MSRRRGSSLLDMGDSVEEIAEKSGFSQSTVRRRVKLLELDKEKFRAAEKRGATLGVRRLCRVGQNREP